MLLPSKKHINKQKQNKHKTDKNIRKSRDWGGGGADYPLHRGGYGPGHYKIGVGDNCKGVGWGLVIIFYIGML